MLCSCLTGSGLWCCAAVGSVYGTDRTGAAAGADGGDAGERGGLIRAPHGQAVFFAHESSVPLGNCSGNFWMFSTDTRVVSVKKLNYYCTGTILQKLVEKAKARPFLRELCFRRNHSTRYIRRNK